MRALKAYMDNPLFCPFSSILLVMGWSEFYDKVCKCLGFYCLSRVVSYIKRTEFYCPLDQSSSCFQLIRSLLKWMIYQDVDDMSLEIRPELSCCYYP